MKRFLSFLAIGSFFATIEEFLTVVVLRNDVGSYLFTLLILFPCFLIFVWITSRLIDHFVPRQPIQSLIHFFSYGIAGLMIEWFLIGLAPWSNPAAHPVLMTIFQLGMFSFWATVAFAPRLFLDPQALSQSARKAILRFYIPYFMFVYFASLLAPRQMKFVVIVPLVLFGYLFLNVFYFKYFRLSLARNGLAPRQLPG